MTRAIGRDRSSAARWILVLSPPRERPKASRSPSATRSLSFDAAPCSRLGVADDLHGGLSGQMRRQTTPGTSGVLMSAHHRRVGCHRPTRVGATLGGLVAAAAQLIQDLAPGTLGRPAAMPVIDGLPVPVATGQIPPRATRPRPPQHPVDHRPVIGPAPTPTRRAIRQQRLQPSPFPISQIMTIKHTDDLPDPPHEIHGTRPSRGVGVVDAADLQGRRVREIVRDHRFDPPWQCRPGGRCDHRRDRRHGRQRGPPAPICQPRHRYETNLQSPPSRCGRVDPSPTAATWPSTRTLQRFYTCCEAADCLTHVQDFLVPHGVWQQMRRYADFSAGTLCLDMTIIVSDSPRGRHPPRRLQSLSGRRRGHFDGRGETFAVRRVGRWIPDQSRSHRIHDCLDVLPLPARHGERPRKAEHSPARKQDGELKIQTDILHLQSIFSQGSLVYALGPAYAGQCALPSTVTVMRDE